MSLNHAVEEIAETIKSQELERKKIVQQLLKKKSELVRLVNPIKVSKVVGIDGGLLTSRLHGLDLVILRSVAVYYENGPNLKVDYYPNPTPIPKLFYLSTDDEVDAHLFASINRQLMEFQVALQSLVKFKPEMLLMDGSIAPYPRKPESGLISREVYNSMIETVLRLFENAEKNKVILAGVSKDSRSRRLSQRMNANFPDTVLLFDVLEVGEMSEVFPIADNPETHAVYRDIKAWGEKIHSFYLKCAKYDRPIRVDYLGDKKDAEKVAGMILSQSCFSNNYGYPTVLIEADQRAKLRELDSEHIYNLISHMVGFSPSLLKLRRELRPY